MNCTLPMLLEYFQERLPDPDKIFIDNSVRGNYQCIAVGRAEINVSHEKVHVCFGHHGYLDFDPHQADFLDELVDFLKDF
jgi:hypothetical protein